MAKEKKDELDDAGQLDPQPQKKGKGPLLKWILIISIVLVLAVSYTHLTLPTTERV